MMDGVPTAQSRAMCVSPRHSHAPCVKASHADTAEVCVALSLAADLPHTSSTEAAHMASLMPACMAFLMPSHVHAYSSCIPHAVTCACIFNHTCCMTCTFSHTCCHSLASAALVLLVLFYGTWQAS